MTFWDRAASTSSTSRTVAKECSVCTESAAMLRRRFVRVLSQERYLQLDLLLELHRDYALIELACL